MKRRVKLILGIFIIALSLFINSASALVNGKNLNENNNIIFNKTEEQIMKELGLKSDYLNNF